VKRKEARSICAGIDRLKHRLQRLTTAGHFRVWENPVGSFTINDRLLTPSETHPEGFPRWTIAAILAWGLAFGWQLMRGEWLGRPKEKTSVVFVHGILSSGDSCWRSTKGSYWPQLLEEVPYLKALGIYVFTYQTGIFSGSYSLLDVVDALKEHMRLDRVAESDSIVFVCHSMGGIVVRKYIVDHAVDLIQEKKTVGLFLVASPSLGAVYADWLSPLAKLFGQR
jgi:pimeloyl-ACP methyl ester carboxylesterase